MYRKTCFPFRDTGYSPVNGVSLLWMCVWVSLSSAADVVFVRDTGYSLEKGVSLHECSEKQRFPFRDTGNFAENGVSRRVRGEEGKGKEGLWVRVGW